MRVLVLLYILLCFSAPAFAYIEENNVGMAEMSAGDQNTNIHKLSTRTDYLIKKLKKIDEYATKNKDEVSSLNVSDIEDISIMEQKDREKQQNKKLLEEIIKTTANPQTLKEAVKPDVYTSLFSTNEVRDSEIALALQKQLRGGHRK